MRRSDRYLLREMCVPALVGGLFVLMLLVGNQLYMLLRYLYNGAPVHDVLMALWYSIPTVLMLAIPAALLLGVALSLNRLEQDRELLAQRMSGVRLTRIVLPLILLGIVASGGMFLLQDRVIPHSARQFEKLKRQLIWGNPTAMVMPDTLMRVGQDFVYVRSVDPSNKVLHGVVVCRMAKGYPTWLVVPRAVKHGDRWVFQADERTGNPPKVYVFDEKGDFIYAEGKGLENWLELKSDMIRYMTDQPTTPDELTLAELRAMQEGVRGSGSRFTGGLYLAPQQLTYYLHKKLAYPLAALVGILIAIPLAVHFGRSGGYVGLLLSVIVAFCFVVSQQWAQVFAETNRMDPILAAWGPIAFFGLFGIVLLIREE